MSSDNDFDDKVAMAAIQAVPVLRKKVASLESELAGYRKKEKVANILKVAEAKQIVLEDNEDTLLAASVEKLASIEGFLKIAHSAGNLKMGEAEEDEEGEGEEKKAEASGPFAELDVLDQFCLDPMNFDVSSIGKRAQQKR